jgi:hypothetical protein
MLLHGTRADVELAGNLFVAAALNQQAQNLLVTGCDLDFVEVDHGAFVCSFSFKLRVATRWNYMQGIRQTFAILLSCLDSYT